MFIFTTSLTSTNRFSFIRTLLYIPWQQNWYLIVAQNGCELDIHSRKFSTDCCCHHANNHEVVQCHRLEKMLLQRWSPVQSSALHPSTHYAIWRLIHSVQKKVAQLSQKDHAAGWVSFGQKWKTGTGRQNFCGHYRSVFNHCDVVGHSKAIEFGEKRKIRAITPFKVIQSYRGRYQSKARIRLPIRPTDRLLLIMTSRTPTVSLSKLPHAAYCSNFGHCVFKSPFGGLGQRTMFILGSLASA